MVEEQMGTGTCGATSRLYSRKWKEVFKKLMSSFETSWMMYVEAAVLKRLGDTKTWTGLSTSEGCQEEADAYRGHSWKFSSNSLYEILLVYDSSSFSSSHSSSVHLGVKDSPFCEGPTRGSCQGLCCTGKDGPARILRFFEDRVFVKKWCHEEVNHSPTVGVFEKMSTKLYELHAFCHACALKAEKKMQQLKLQEDADRAKLHQVTRAKGLCLKFSEVLKVFWKMKISVSTSSRNSKSFLGELALVQVNWGMGEDAVEVPMEDPTTVCLW